MSSASPAPTTSTDLGDNQTQHFWDLEQVPNSGTSIDLKFLFDNLIVGETRPALAEAYLEFTNTFKPDEVIKVPLDIPNITVEQPVDLALDLDKTQYLGFEEVLVTQIVTNQSDALFDGTLEYQIESSEGGLTYQFTVQTVDQLAGFSEELLFDSWNTEQTFVGNYIVKSTLYDARGNATATATAPFEIVDEASLTPSLGATLRTTTDRTLYNVNDVVEIGDLVANLATNVIIEDAQLYVQVINSANEVVHQFTRNFAQLTPEFSHLYTDVYNLLDEPIGDYRVVGQILAQNGDEEGIMYF